MMFDFMENMFYVLYGPSHIELLVIFPEIIVTKFVENINIYGSNECS
jgi:hypothetical protein